MERRGEEAFYISDYGRKTVSLMNREGKIIKEYSLSGHPGKIVTDTNNTGIFTACDVDSKLCYIDFLADSIKEVSLENDGNIQLSREQGYLYVSNTSEINIISASRLEKLKTIDDFVAISRFTIDEKRQRLYVVDTILESIRIYDTESYKLMDEIRRIGMRPLLTSFEADTQRFYILCRGNLEDGYLPELLMVDVQTKNKSRILFLKDGDIADMCSCQDKVFLANKKNNKIDIIDIHAHKIIASVPTTLPGIQKLSISENSGKLLITLKSGEKHGKIDILDVDNLIIEKSLNFDAEGSKPLWVVSFPFHESQRDMPKGVDKKKETTKDPTFSEELFGKIIKRRIYPCLSIFLPDSAGYPPRFEKVEFDKESVFYPSFAIKPVEGKMNYYTIALEIQMPYYFIYHGMREQQFIYEGMIEDRIIHFMHIPPSIIQVGFVIDAKVQVNLQGSPIITQDGFRFTADSFMKFYCRTKGSGNKEFPIYYAESGDVWM